MESLCKSLDGLPLIVKIILALPGIDIVWNIYRICKSGSKGNVVGVVLAVLCLLFLSWNILWLIDIICIVVKGSVWWLD